MSETINIKLTTSSDLETFYDYTNAYKKIISEYGANYNGFSENWYQRPNTYSCVFYNNKKKVIAGYWLQLHQAEYNLPIQNKQTKYDTKIDAFIKEQPHFKLCEFGGFFVTSDYRKTLISREVMRSTLAYSLLLDLRTVIGITLEKTTSLLNSLNIFEKRNIMATDQYFLYADNPKSFVFEIHNFSEQARKNLDINEETRIIKNILKNHSFSYNINTNEKQYHFLFQHFIPHFELYT